ncbi:MAG: hypothetical protein K6C30_09135 [Bacteroidaceae bacterium]|nr:hypothetical protein [Bacteroidaceae bacterium]
MFHISEKSYTFASEKRGAEEELLNPLKHIKLVGAKFGQFIENNYFCTNLNIRIARRPSEARHPQKRRPSEARHHQKTRALRSQASSKNEGPQEPSIIKKRGTSEARKPLVDDKIHISKKQ